MHDEEIMRLVFKDTKITICTANPAEDGATQVLKVRALLSRPLAGQLRCGDICFDDNGIPRTFSTIKLRELIKPAEVVLSCGTFCANKVYDFLIQRPKDASATDASLEIHCSLHFDGSVPINSFVIDQNKAAFEMTVKPPMGWQPQSAQMALGLSEGTEDDEESEEEGEEVEITGRLISVEQAADTREADNDLPGPTLMPAVLTGGTHAKRRRGQHNPDKEAVEQRRQGRDAARGAIADGTAPIDVESEVIQ